MKQLSIIVLIDKKNYEKIKRTLMFLGLN